MIDAIKIDKSFTHAIGTQAVTVSILPQILAMADTLKLQVIVEGIETELQANFFGRTNRFLLAQASAFGRAVSADEFHRLLAEEDEQEKVPVLNNQSARPRPSSKPASTSFSTSQ